MTIRAWALAAAFLAGCSGAPPDGGADFEVDLTAKKPANPDSTGKADEEAPPPSGTEPREDTPTATGGAPVPAANDVVWTGKLARSPIVRFGGSPYCDYSVTYSDIDISLTLDGSNQLKAATISGLMTETATSCSQPTVPSNRHTFTFAKKAPDPNLETTIPGALANKPKTEVIVTRPATAGDSMSVKLRFNRMDQSGSLDWSVTATATLKR